MSTTEPKLRPHWLPENDGQFERVRYYIEDEPVPEYRHACQAAVEAFRDWKYGVRIVWGLYAMQEREASWDIVTSYNHQQRQDYQQLYKQFNPTDFNAEKWMNLFDRAGLKSFAITTKHCDGFCLWPTKSRVKQRINWTAPGGPVIEDCDFAYSIEDGPFKRDIVKELCDAARQHDIKIDLYFTHPDWYDADFRSYGLHPVQTPLYRSDPAAYGNGTGTLDPAHMMAPDQTPAETDRMMHRYGQQFLELLTDYGKVDMICFDQWMGPQVWPALRDLLLQARKIQPDVMFRARGIGNYGDYYTPEGFVPDDKEPTTVPWFVIKCLAKLFAYDPDASQYKDGRWIIHTLIDSVSKGGNFMITLGPDAKGNFHPKAVTAMEDAGKWLKTNGEAIYATRERPGSLWKEGDNVRFTRSKDNRFIYALCLEWPGKSLELKTVRPREGSTIRLLGVDPSLKWRITDDGVKIDLPAPPPPSYAYAFKIENGD